MIKIMAGGGTPPPPTEDEDAVEPDVRRRVRLLGSSLAADGAGPEADTDWSQVQKYSISMRGGGGGGGGGGGW
ncbi:hypothetical protein [Streptomyces sp. AK02-01A]|uniref:hypothetical protein n=1 Tax=Streptomyces sp. AK02-01A TaxID=3028648 RepID=UPI0029BAA443|nr:hypothetical protein [Streptomyces sp. AK02-01A]MDX3849713.1 hypothetical protein [Streptomyces sp. AK02-01A]MDX3849717.1 hypothetical protein [Streptomyces sp. AK02-01A]